MQHHYTDLELTKKKVHQKIRPNTVTYMYVCMLKNVLFGHSKKRRCFMIAIKKNIHPIPHDVDQINYLAFDYEQNTYRIDSYKKTLQ